MMPGNLLIPILFVLLQGCCIFGIMDLMTHIENDDLLDKFKIIFPVSSLITLICYMCAACTNPGYVIGNEEK